MANETQLKGDQMRQAIAEHRLSEYFPDRYIEDRDIMLFQSQQMLDNGYHIIIAISLDKTVYNKISFLLLKLDENSEEEKILKVVNRLNNHYPNLKFSLSEHNELELEFTYIANAKQFDATFLLNLIRVTVREVDNDVFDHLLKELGIA